MSQIFEPEVLGPELASVKPESRDKTGNTVLRQMHREKVRRRNWHSREARKLLPFLIERSGGGCDICGFTFKPAIVPHHLQMLEHWGETDQYNLVALCQNCHAIIHYFINDRVKRMPEKLKEAASLFPEEKARRMLIMSTEQVRVNGNGNLFLALEKKIYQQRALVFLGMEIPEDRRDARQWEGGYRV